MDHLTENAFVDKDGMLFAKAVDFLSVSSAMTPILMTVTVWGCAGDCAGGWAGEEAGTAPDFFLSPPLPPLSAPTSAVVRDVGLEDAVPVGFDALLDAFE